LGPYTPLGNFYALPFFFYVFSPESLSRGSRRSSLRGRVFFFFPYPFDTFSGPAALPLSFNFFFLAPFPLGPSLFPLLAEENGNLSLLESSERRRAFTFECRLRSASPPLSVTGNGFSSLGIFTVASFSLVCFLALFGQIGDELF